MKSPTSMPRTPPSRIPSAARSTLGAKRFTVSTAPWPRAASSKPRCVTLRALGHEAAFFWRLTMNLGEAGMRIDIISVMTFDDDAKITSMKAYWGPDNITQL